MAMAIPTMLGTAGGTALTATGSTALASAGLTAASSAGAALVAATPGALATIAPTAGLFGSAGAFSWMTAGKTLLTGLGIGGTITSGLSTASSLRQQSRYEKFQARQAELQGLKEENDAREAFLDEWAALEASNAARFSSVDLTGATTRNALTDKLLATAERQLATISDNTSIQSSAYRLQSEVTRRRIPGAIASGVGGAASGLLDLAG